MHALDKHGDFADLRYYCSCVYRRLGRIADAIEQSQRALEINPRFVKALVLLAQLYAQTDRHEQAIDRLQSAIAWGANYADLHYALGKLCQEKGYLAKARSHYRRALRINDTYCAAREALAGLAA